MAASSSCAGEPRGLLRWGQRIFRISSFLSRENGNPLRPQRRPAPLAQGSQGSSCGRYSVFSNIELPFTGERQPLRPQRRPAPPTGEPGGLPRGYSVFFEYRMPFHGGTATPQAETAASSPHRGQGASLRGEQRIFRISGFLSQPLRPQRRPAPPCAGGAKGNTRRRSGTKRGSGGEPLGTLFFDLRQRLFGYCKNTSPHPRRR